MNQDIKIEALENLKRDIVFGFNSEEELFESIRELFYDYDDFDEDWLHSEISTRFEAHQNQSLTWQKPTDFERLVKVFDQLNKEKIVSLHKAGYTRQDAEGDCHDVIEDLKAMEIKAKGYCYYHAQDLERAIAEEAMLFIGYDSTEQNDEKAREVANTIISTLQNNGFETKWNGSLNSRIEIKNINWQKAYDEIDYNYSRVISVFEDNHISIKEVAVKKKPFWKFW